MIKNLKSQTDIFLKMTSTKQKSKLKKFIRELASIRGRHTELVSVYVPQDYDLNKIVNHLSQEQGTADNIKSTSTKECEGCVGTNYSAFAVI